MIDFGFSAEDGSITHDGASLDKSSQLDLDDSTMLVLHVEPVDASGLVVGDVIKLSADTPHGELRRYLWVWGTAWNAV
jgi:hypothetical protein